MVGLLIVPKKKMDYTKNYKLLTIIIPSYNMEAYLEKAVQSLVVERELFDLLDIIIVNDGSKDQTLNIALLYANMYSSSISVIDKTNGNYGSCVNAGIKKAKGAFIKILDADDTFEIEAFKSYLRELLLSEERKELVDLFVTDGLIVDEFGTFNVKFDT